MYKYKKIHPNLKSENNLGKGAKMKGGKYFPEYITHRG